MGYQVFISYKHTTMDGTGVTRDYTIANELHGALTRAGVKTFFSEKDLSTGDYINEIYRALDEARIMIVVGTRPEYIDSEWVREEWSTFIAAINGRRKPNGDVYTYLEGMSINNLPMMLYKRQSYTTSEKERLIGRITAQLGIKTNAKSDTPGTPTPPPTPRLNVQVGGKVQFGQYPQGADGEMQPLVWRVLAVENGRALLITDKLIDCVQYNGTDTDVTWETCTLREWMNNDFISKAFSSSQQAQIATVTNRNPDNPNGGFFGHKRINGGNATQDRIFAFSIDEVNKYFRDDDDRMAAPTGYAKKQGCYVSDVCSLSTGEKTGWWWLRSPGYDGVYAADVEFDGNVDRIGSFVNFNKVAVRPAFWLNL